MLEIIGVIGAILIIYSNIPQMIKFYRQGHANGISFAATHVAFMGILLRGYYQFHVTNFNWIITVPYIFSFICIMTTYYYLYKGKNR